MIIEARSSQIDVTPRKMRMLSHAIKNLKPELAITQLGHMNFAAATPLKKVIKQAIANAVNNYKLNPDTLVIKEIIVNQGWMLKRWQAGARGRGKPYTKRRSHVTVKLESKTIETKPQKSKAVKTSPKKAVKEVSAPKKTKVTTAKKVTKKTIKK